MLFCPGVLLMASISATVTATSNSCGKNCAKVEPGLAELPACVSPVLRPVAACAGCACKHQMCTSKTLQISAHPVAPGTGKRSQCCLSESCGSICTWNPEVARLSVLPSYRMPALGLQLPAWAAHVNSRLCNLNDVALLRTKVHAQSACSQSLCTG